MTLSLINGGRETLPVLALSTSAEIFFTSSDEATVLVGNKPNDMQPYRTIKRNEAFSRAFSTSFQSDRITVEDLAVGSWMKIVSDKPMTSASLRWKGEDALMITPNEVSMMARPCHADEQKIMRYIAEAEQNDIKTKLGDDLFIRLKAGEENFLLNGGTYLRGGKRYQLNGVKRALAYYTYSRLVESSSIELTRQGAVNRRSEYSEDASRNDVLSAVRETYAIADRYMEECIFYINDGCAKEKFNSKTTIKIIGK